VQFRISGYEGERERARVRIAAAEQSNPTLVVLLVVAFVALAAALYLVAPGKVVTSKDVPNADHRLKLQNDVRTTGIQLLAGVLLAIGAIYTARTFRSIARDRSPSATHEL
jgi:hypothetical protein